MARYTAGESIRALSREHGVSRGGLCQLLQSEGVALRGQGIALEDMERAVQLYEKGLTIRQVVDLIGYSYGTIRSTLHENGVAMRADGRGERPAPDQRS